MRVAVFVEESFSVLNPCFNEISWRAFELATSRLTEVLEVQKTMGMVLANELDESNMGGFVSAVVGRSPSERRTCQQNGHSLPL